MQNKLSNLLIVTSQGCYKFLCGIEVHLQFSPSLDTFVSIPSKNIKFCFKMYILEMEWFVVGFIFILFGNFFSVLLIKCCKMQFYPEMTHTKFSGNKFSGEKSYSM